MLEVFLGVRVLPVEVAATGQQVFGVDLPGPLAADGRFLLAKPFYVIQELQEHDPGEHRQTVEVAVQPLVLAHDVPRGLGETAELLSCGEILRGFPRYLGWHSV